jgi:CRP-like cAMP-binding protein
MDHAQSAIRRVFSRNYLLQHFSPDELDRFAAVATTRSYSPGQCIFMKGDPGVSMMAVLAGRVRISSYSQDGREVVLAVFGPGEVFGEIALIDGGERTADAFALEPTDVVVLNRRDFLPCLQRNPEACVKLLEIMCQRMRRTDEHVEDLSFLQLRPRLAKRLVFLAENYGKPVAGGVLITIRLPQQLLASMMGTSREAVNKQLRSWEESGFIDVRRGTITVLDRPALERVVGEEP